MLSRTHHEISRESWNISPCKEAVDWKRNLLFDRKMSTVINIFIDLHSCWKDSGFYQVASIYLRNKDFVAIHFLLRKWLSHEWLRMSGNCSTSTSNLNWSALILLRARNTSILLDRKVFSDLAWFAPCKKTALTKLSLANVGALSDRVKRFPFEGLIIKLEKDPARGLIALRPLLALKALLTAYCSFFAGSSSHRSRFWQILLLDKKPSDSNPTHSRWVLRVPLLDCALMKRCLLVARSRAFSHSLRLLTARFQPPCKWKKRAE